MSTDERSISAGAAGAYVAFATDRICSSLVNAILERRPVAHPVPPNSARRRLREAGLTSLEMVNLMLAVEAEFDLDIPDVDMTLRNFRSISSIEALVGALSAKQVRRERDL